ncbi:MAG: Calcineurin-like phosphoesterase [Methanoregulaceae archaeon PtaB.Bin056]|jgi:hypothetical protein|nr:MAG: Calcineurin-like phosphoesterase [Methanoregulaceae archaeon PtaB.Bin056]
MRLEFLETGPALLVEEDLRVLVAGDLHLGIESDLSRHGLHIRSRSRERKERLLACIESASPDLLLLLGDVKHNVPLTSRQEFRELPAILDAFRSKVPIRLVPGNHDPGIEVFFEKGEVLSKTGALIDGVGYIHGHTYPDPLLQGHLIIAGHHHPMVSIRDEVGCALRAPGYLLAAVDDACLQFPQSPCRETGETRVLFIPALNELAGYDVMRTVKEPFSPLSRCMNFEQSEVFLADGTFLGPLSSLEDHGDTPDA